MDLNTSASSEIHLLLAADQRFSTVDPQDDHIWELNNAQGEPPGLALHTTFGLRAYSMRIYPRFTYQNIAISDPKAFAKGPIVDFSAPNFAALHFSPFTVLDVTEKVWVPESHTIVGQITVQNSTSNLVQAAMEWVVLLHPLEAGSPMSATQISVNTVLQGQTQHLYPVFLLTGGPQANLSAFSSLGMELILPPNAMRQFTWALASEDSTNASFYAARKSSAYLLDQQHVKLAMLHKHQTLSFDFHEPILNERLQASQKLAFQLLLPPHRNFHYPSYVAERLPDNGNNPSERGRDYSSLWGVQQLFELFEISRALLPLAPHFIKGMLQNLLDQQNEDGAIFAQTTWNGHLTNLPAAPMLASMILELEDETWLRSAYPVLIRTLRSWRKSNEDLNETAPLRWKHLLQTGLTDTPWMDQQTRLTLETLIHCAHWPSLAALYLNECRCLIKMANKLGNSDDLPWLEKDIQQMENFLDQSWDEEAGFYRFRDPETSSEQESRTVKVFRMDGISDLDMPFTEPTRLVLKLTTKDQNPRTVECQIKGIVRHHEKKILLESRKMQWIDKTGISVTDDAFSGIKQISVNGLKKGDHLIIETPDFGFKGPDFLIPLWVGIPNQQRATRMIETATGYLDQVGQKLPLFLIIMWLEALIRYDHKKMAGDYFTKWFLTKDNPLPAYSSINSRNSIHQLVPLKTMLSLMGIRRIKENEVLIEDFNDFLPRVNVQYKSIGLDLEPHKTRFWALNGEQVEITQPGVHRITLP